jgi:hypothetical protein
VFQFFEKLPMSPFTVRAAGEGFFAFPLIGGCLAARTSRFLITVSLSTHAEKRSKLQPVAWAQPG